MTDAIIIQSPETQPAQLFILFHGAGSSAPAMVTIGHQLAQAFPQGFVVSVNAPTTSELGFGFQWFSLRGITEENRKARVHAAMPEFIKIVSDWQLETGVRVEATALVGFSQGATMVLESLVQTQPLAGRVIAIAGRFTALPDHTTADTTLHIIHGKDDPIISYKDTIVAAEHLISLGADVTADIIPFVGHEINQEIGALAIERLKGYIPKQKWAQALKSVPD